MSNPKNTQSLTNFLSHSLSVLCMRTIITPTSRSSRRILRWQGGFLINYGYSFDVPSSCFNHEEADTQNLLYSKHAATTYQRIVIQLPNISWVSNVKSCGLKQESRIGQDLFSFTLYNLALVLSYPSPYQPTMHQQVVTQQVHFLVLVRRKE